MNGKLIVTNTIEDLINKDKKELLSQFGTEVGGFHYNIII